MNGDEASQRMRFCRECNNLLVPRENRDTQELEYVCKLIDCHFVDTTFDGTCVYKSNYGSDTATNLSTVLSANNQDPALPRNYDVDCSQCNHNVAVYFMAEQTSKSTKLKFVYVCESCGFKWIE